MPSPDFQITGSELSSDEITLAAGVPKTVQVAGLLDSVTIHVTGPAIRYTVDSPNVDLAATPRKGKYVPADSTVTDDDPSGPCTLQLLSASGGSVVVVVRGS